MSNNAEVGLYRQTLIKQQMENKSSTQNVIDISIKLAILALIIIWCFTLIMPFVSIILWGIILALAAHPLVKILTNRLGGKKKLSVILIVIFGLLLIAIPAWLFLDSVIEGVNNLRANFDPDNSCVANNLLSVLRVKSCCRSFMDNLPTIGRCLR